MSTLTFPHSFLWGAATAAHQIEGNNVGSDWWARETAPESAVAERSGDAADSYHRYREDISLLARSGLTHYRFSLEWSRIEPAPGMFSRAAIAHYGRVVEACLDAGVVPIVTLHHFTVPQWFAAQGGWRHAQAPELFERFAARVVHLLAPCPYVITINEPNILAMMAGGEKGDAELQAGALPSPDEVVSNALIGAHKRAVRVLRSAGLRAGWSVAPQQFFADPGAEEVLADYAYPREGLFLESSRGDDFVAVQAYTRTRISLEGPQPAPSDAEVTLTGWEYYPPAIAEAARQAYDLTGLPVLVSENGIATADDERRIDYTRAALSALHAEMARGLPVIGYLHWSLLDNYEWGSYGPTFGLIAFDAETFKRTPKASLWWLGRVARGGVMESV
ncbi:glycoside hydrolase family 1 protein [Serinibacter salmoneus]|uniref:Beta-glucosidase n=1 Tax=Serinibacter salmoneus TaxID=556530 RepID=A0A2A9CW45_9MICO|nr:family 1 glycosylhydrolase [Serinibacter salmoneus]PFG18623.1 beta-glucosidase [Serinibacter salmoneus]